MGRDFPALRAFGGDEVVVEVEDFLLRDGLDFGDFDLVAVEVELLRRDLAPEAERKSKSS